MEATKVYVDERDGDWILSLTPSEPSRLASIRHLEADVRDGSSPFLTWVEVEEGVFYWDAQSKAYVNAEKGRQAGLRRSNPVSVILFNLGAWIFIFGLLYAIVESDGRLPQLFLLAAASFTVGMLVVGLAEVIRLLQKIADKD
ncbi:hypothetical protein [Paenibacillus sp. GYB003]|uniref:hypothetical protein n=1 Tax=Paenibacillus sp. GYB003 TaxID=2994392 RepID=UPI002F9622BE